MKATWAVLEDQFPQSINRAVDIHKLRRGECVDIDMVDIEKDGLLKYAQKPSVSKTFFAKKFVNNTGSSGSNVDRIWAFSRWWRIDNETPYRLEYSDLGEEEEETFIQAGYIDFDEDGQERISLLIPYRGTSFVVLKPQCGYVLSNVNGASSGFNLSTAFWGIGNSNPGSWYSNAIIGGHIVTVWDGGGAHGLRHYMWNTSDGQEELSNNVRPLSEAQDEEVRAELNWSQNLVIAGNVCYDLVKRRIYQFTGAGTTIYHSRVYNEVNYKPIMWQSIGFIVNGDVGSFTAKFQYGALGTDKEEEIEKTFDVSAQQQSHKFIEWNFNNVITTRTCRIKIENLTGLGIVQIMGLSIITSSERAPEYE